MDLIQRIFEKNPAFLNPAWIKSRITEQALLTIKKKKKKLEKKRKNGNCGASPRAYSMPKEKKKGRGFAPHFPEKKMYEKKTIPPVIKKYLTEYVRKWRFNLTASIRRLLFSMYNMLKESAFVLILCNMDNISLLYTIYA